MSSNPPTFRAVGADWFLHWTPTDLVGSDSVEDAVRAVVAGAGRTLAYSPVGPYVPATLSHPLAVLAALSRVAPSPFELVSEGVDFTDTLVPEGAVS